jgi:hypothetical protein
LTCALKYLISVPEPELNQPLFAVLNQFSDDLIDKQEVISTLQLKVLHDQDFHKPDDNLYGTIYNDIFNKLDYLHDFEKWSFYGGAEVIELETTVDQQENTSQKVLLSHLSTKKGILCNSPDKYNMSFKSISSLDLISHLNSHSDFSKNSNKINSQEVCCKCLQACQKLKQNNQLQKLALRKYAPEMALSQIPIDRVKNNSTIIVDQLATVKTQKSFNYLIKKVLWQDIVTQAIKTHNSAADLRIHSFSKITDSIQINKVNNWINLDHSVLSKEMINEFPEITSFSF